jgi:hypothetical protein
MRQLLKSEGILIGVLFNKDFEGGPPFGGNLLDYQKLFEKHFQHVDIQLCYNSIPQRMNSEVFIQIQ